MCSICSFWYVFVPFELFQVSARRHLLVFCYWRFFFMLSRLIAIDSQGILHLVLGLVAIHSAAVSIWVVTKFSHSSFGVCLLDVFWSVSNLFLTLTVWRWPRADQSYREVLPVCFFCFRVDSCEKLLRRSCNKKILLQKDEYTSQFTALFIHFLFMRIWPRSA